MPWPEKCVAKACLKMQSETDRWWENKFFVILETEAEISKVVSNSGSGL